MNSVEVRGALKTYGKNDDKKVILNGLNMTVAPNSIYSLIGASGCGKTTLLSCILGINALDSGSIRVLGHKVVHNSVSKIGHLIGFMPQDISLIEELTIYETLNYFGNIFLMDPKLLEEESKMIVKLLELPTDERQICQLSGGQQRRVSLAVSIMHKPLVLILDEPTVGLDSLLREKIWAFLIKSTRESNMSVIITTHYMQEALQSDRCGMMRGGVLLAEDSPGNILSMYEVNDLDEAFLKLCSKQSRSDIPCIESQECVEESPNQFDETFEKRGKFKAQTIRALIKKEYIRLKRSYYETTLVFLLPFVTVLSIAYTIGGLPRGLKLGVVNNEVRNPSACDFHLTQNVSHLSADNECVISFASCHLLREITVSDVENVYYDSFESAFRDAKKGRVSGVMTIHSNITELLESYLESSESLNSCIDIHLDGSELQLYTVLQRQLYQAYERFIKNALRNCSVSERSFTFPMNFSETLYGSIDNDFRSSYAPTYILQSIASGALGFSSLIAAQTRVSGVWNRTLLAGVRTYELLFTQIIFCILAEMITLVETWIITYLLLNITGNAVLLIVFGIVVVTNAAVMGVVIAVFFEDAVSITFVWLALMQTFITLGGAYWPLEGQPAPLLYFSKCLPFTIPTVSIRNIALKGCGLEDTLVQAGFLISFIYIALSVTVGHFVLSKNKFSRISK